VQDTNHHTAYRDSTQKWVTTKQREGAEREKVREDKGHGLNFFALDNLLVELKPRGKRGDFGGTI
jgi:hypothetical protein